ncbi:MAG: DUF1552 domain-containing protein [Myxococcota bacterium]
MRRRNFLVGLGGITVGLPMLRRFGEASLAHAGGTDHVPTRIITVAYDMGTHIPQWKPSAVGADFELGTITAAMEPFRDRALFVSNCSNDVLELVDGYPGGHPGKKEAVFTGTLMQHAFTGDLSNHIDNVIQSSPEGHTRTANGPSVEHVIGQALRRPEHPRVSVDLGVWGPGGVREPQPSYFFYESAANPVSMPVHPALAFASLFSGVTPDGEDVDEAFLALQRRNASVLDAVRDSFVDLRQGLDAEDRRRLDEHADKIRQIELDMPPLASCSLPTGIPEGEGAYDGMSMSEIVDLQIRILAHAMGCGLAPVGRLEFLFQHGAYFGIPLVDDAAQAAGNWHHPIVHGLDGWALDSEVRVTGFKFYVDKFAELCAQLDAIPEGPDGRSVLDNSLVVLGTDLGEGNLHRADDLCFLVAGNSGPGRRGYHFDAEGYNVNQLLTTLVHMAGVTNDDGSLVQEFGLRGFTQGVIDPLLT